MERRNITVIFERGGTEREICADCYDGLAVHPTLNATSNLCPGDWTVTHIATKRAVYVHCPSQAVAVAAVMRMLPLGCDWTSRDVAQTPGLKRELKQIAKALGIRW